LYLVVLTDRELEVRKLRKEGKTQADIAKLLNISQPAVSAFERNAERKIKQADELLAQLRKLGLLMLIVAMGLVIPHAVSAQIPSPGHPAWETGPGTNGSFYPGDYRILGSFNVTTIVHTPQICLNGDCQTSWPSGSGGGNVTSSNGASGYLARFTNSTNIATGTLYDSGSQIGIGDASPSQLLDIDGTNAQILIEESTTEFFRAGVGETASTAVIGWDDADSLLLGVYSSPTDTTISSLVEIESDGDVGIGTTSPGAKLEVVGDIISKGTVWTTRSAAGDNDAWGRVKYGNGLFVAVGTGSDRVMTSPDGTTWTVRSAAGNDDSWIGVAYGNGTFVAVGSNGDRVMTSPDGITWTARSAVGDNDVWNSVAYGNGLFVAVGQSGDRVMTSPDGITWTNQSAAGNDDTWQSVTYGNGLFVAVGRAGGDRVMTSPDGITWTARSAAGNNDAWYDVTYGDGLFVAVAYTTGDRVMTSPDGTTWTVRSAAGNDDTWFGVTYGGGVFVAVGSSTDRVMTSGKPEKAVLPNNNIYQGGMTIRGGAAVSGNFFVTNGTGSNLLRVEATSNEVRLGDSNRSVALFVNGTINATGSITQNSGFDVAEMFSADEAMSAGDLVIATGEETVALATKANADLVIGAVSGDPGFILANPDLDDPVMIGLAGRIPVKVTGAVQRGDFITVSDTPGVGEAAREPGYVIGRAIGDVRADGTVLMIIQPQYFAPVINAQNELSGGRAGKAFTGVPDVTAFAAIERGSVGAANQQLARTGDDVVLSLSPSEDFVVTLG
jgi:hypothetical protein